jgi:hypothetical protein
VFVIISNIGAFYHKNSDFSLPGNLVAFRQLLGMTFRSSGASACNNDTEAQNTVKKTMYASALDTSP